MHDAEEKPHGLTDPKLPYLNRVWGATVSVQRLADALRFAVEALQEIDEHAAKGRSRDPFQHKLGHDAIVGLTAELGHWIEDLRDNVVNPHEVKVQAEEYDRVVGKPEGEGTLRTS